MRFLLIFLISITFATTTTTAQTETTRRLSRSVLEDKIRGGWAGQMIGVSYGAPTEFRSNGISSKKSGSI